MFALFLTAVSALAAIAAVALLVDGGLRWWSAFGQLGHRLQLPTEAQVCESGMRRTLAHGGFTRPGRVAAITRQTVRRAA